MKILPQNSPGMIPRCFPWKCLRPKRDPCFPPCCQTIHPGCSPHRRRECSPCCFPDRFRLPAKTRRSLLHLLYGRDAQKGQIQAEGQGISLRNALSGRRSFSFSHYSSDNTNKGPEGPLLMSDQIPPCEFSPPKVFRSERSPASAWECGSSCCCRIPRSRYHPSCR